MSFHPGWMLVVLGAGLLIAGLIWMFAPGVPLGRLPGDIRIQGKNSSFYFPLTTCLLLSAVFSLVMWLLKR